MKICNILGLFAETLACFALVTAVYARTDHSSSSATSACPCNRAILQEVRQNASEALTARNLNFDTGLIILSGECRQIYQFDDFNRSCVQRYAVDIDTSRKPEFLLKMGCGEPNPDLVPQPGLYHCEPDSTRVQKTVKLPCNTHHEPIHESQVLADTCKLVESPRQRRPLIGKFLRLKQLLRLKQKKGQLIRKFFRLVSQLLLL